MRFWRNSKQQYVSNSLQKISALLKACSPLLSGLALLLPAPCNELSLVLLTVVHWVILSKTSEYLEHLEALYLLTSAQQSLRLYQESAQQRASRRQP